jgi:hypothetical protein
MLAGLPVAIPSMTNDAPALTLVWPHTSISFPAHRIERVGFTDFEGLGLRV